MQRWLIDQQKILIEYPDFLDEAKKANNLVFLLNGWTKESLAGSALVLTTAQLMIFYSLIVPLIFPGSYIPTEGIAILQPTIWIYAWITWKRYHRSRGMCYGIDVQVNAAKILDNDKETEKPE